MSKTDTLEVPSATTEPSNNLKHLSFVSDAAARASAVSDTLYKQARSYTPAGAETFVSNVEETVAAYAAPVVNKAGDVGEGILSRADDQVEYVLNTTRQNLDDVRTGKYFDYLADVSTWVSNKLSPSKTLAFAKDQLHAAISQADKLTDPDAAIGNVQAAWSHFASIPAVGKTLAAFEPLTKWGQHSFFSVHDRLVHSGYYKYAIDASGSALAWATTTTPYKLSTRYLYPWVQPVAEPAIGKLSGSKALSSAISYWKPSVTV